MNSLKQSMTMIRSEALAALALALALLPAPGLGVRAAAADTASAAAAEQAIRETADEVLAILRDTTTDAATKRAKIEATLVPKADFETIAKLVLARNWTKFSPQQRSDFVVALKQYLSRTYGRNVDSFNNETVEITGSRDETRGDKTVHSKILRGTAEPILVDYRLRNKDGQWLIIDIIAEGISMVSNLRSQFQEILSGGSPDELLRVLREKNAEA